MLTNRYTCYYGFTLGDQGSNGNDFPIILRTNKKMINRQAQVHNTNVNYRDGRPLLARKIAVNVLSPAAQLTPPGINRNKPLEINLNNMKK